MPTDMDRNANGGSLRTTFGGLRSLVFLAARCARLSADSVLSSFWRLDFRRTPLDFMLGPLSAASFAETGGAKCVVKKMFPFSFVYLLVLILGIPPSLKTIARKHSNQPNTISSENVLHVIPNINFRKLISDTILS